MNLNLLLNPIKSSFSVLAFLLLFPSILSAQAYYMCSDTESNELTGTIYDSGGPLENYSSNENCGFLIQPPCADEIRLSFNQFALKHNDILYIYDGVDATGVLLMSASGSSLPHTFTVTSGSIFLRFRSDGSIVDSGFEAQWVTVQNLETGTAEFIVSTTNSAIGEEVFFTDESIGGIASYSWDVTGDGNENFSSQNISYIFPSPGTYEVELTIADCNGGTSTHIETVIVQDYPEINVTTSEPVSYVFNTCHYTETHTLTISNPGMGDLTWSIDSEGLTVIPSSGILSEGSSIDVEIGLSAYLSEGLFVETLLINSNDIITPIIEHIIEIEQTVNCTFIMCADSESTNLKGTVYDSGGPLGVYGIHENCGFLIHPPCADEITLKFNQFYTQINSDYIYVYDGVDFTSPLLLASSGGVLPNAVTATSGAMFVRFRSDGSGVRSGFEAEWNTVQSLEIGVANFIASTTTPAVGEEVFFTDASIGGVALYSWDVTGDGIEDYTSQNVSHIFETPGTYDVELTITDCNGVTSTHIETIVVQEYPEINITPSAPMAYTLNSCDDSEVHTLTISNTGLGDLTWSIESERLTVVPSNGIMSAGSSIEVEVRFSIYPSEGLFVETLLINSNDINMPEIEYLLEIDQTVNCSFIMCVDTESAYLTGTVYDSGGALGHYSYGENCGFLIQPPCADKIRLSFNQFATHNKFLKGKWHSHYLRVYDGVDATGVLLLSHAGSEIPNSVTATSGSMYLHFSSAESSGSNSGYEAQWTTIQHFEEGDANFTISSSTPAIGEEVFFTDVSTGGIALWSWDITGDGIEDYSIQNPSHVFNVPGTYDVELTTIDCNGNLSAYIETIVVQDYSEISVTTADPMNYIFDSCDAIESHTITILNIGSGDLSWSIDVGDLIASPSSGVINSGGSIDVEIGLNSYLIAGIFSETISISSNDLNNPLIEHVLEINQTESCEYTMCTDVVSNTLIGKIYDSGGFNFNYGNDENCGFLIQPPCADEIRLSFNQFSTELDWADVLRVYDGVDATGTLLLSASGSSIPNTVTATSGAMFLHFRSDASQTYKGFEAQWTTVQNLETGEAGFTVSTANPAIGEEVFFTNASIGGIASYSWDVTADGITDYTNQNPSHVFTVSGTYEVELIILDCNGETSSHIETIVVQDYPEISVTTVNSMNYTFDLCNEAEIYTHTITILNIGSGDLTWSIDVGDLIASPSSGVINSGGSIDVEIGLNSYFTAGIFTETISISSNDFANPLIEHVLEINQTGNCEYTMCTDVVSNTQAGKIYDSGGPNENYGNNENCGFLIQPPCADEITLTFNQFYTQNFYDRIQVYDGVDASGTLLLIASGTTSLPGTVVANSGAMYLHFISNSSVVYSGFEAQWTTVQDFETGEVGFTTSTTSPAIGEEVFFTDISTGLIASISWDFTGDGTEDYSSQSVSHIFTAPGTYDVELTIVYCNGETNTHTETIVVQEYPIISVSTSETMDYTFNSCNDPETHTLTISNIGLGDLIWSIESGGLAVIPSSGIVSAGSSIDVEVSLSVYLSEGLFIETLLINSNDITTPVFEYVLEIEQTIDCTFIMCTDSESANLTGTVYDSGGPLGNYRNNENCGFLIQPPCADEITLSFNQFVTQSSAYSSDVLSVYDGVDETGVLLLTAKGSALPNTLTAISGAMYLHFTSTSSIVDTGFEAQWVAVQGLEVGVADFTLSTTILAFGEEVFFTDVSTGGVVSYSWDVTGNGAEDYSSQNVSHIYTIPGTYDVELTIVDCNGETSTHIETIIVQDYPEISISSSDPMNYTFDLCNETETHTITISNSGLGDLIWSIESGGLIVIPSSGIVSAGSSVDVEVSLLTYSTQGLFVETLLINSNDITTPVFEYMFEIEQTIGCTFIMCSNTESINLTGTIYDSGGPLGNYSNNENCGFLIQPPCADEITLSFNQFVVENHFDKLHVYDGVDATGALLLTATGHTLPNTVTAMSGSMFLQFISDYTVAYFGFEAQWMTVQNLELGVASFTASTTTPAVGEEVFFTDTSIGIIASYSWDVTGDGVENQSNQNPSHIYTSPGTYDVELTIVDCNGETSTHIETIIVQDYPEISISTSDPMNYTFDLCNETETHTITISNSGLGDLIWSIESEGVTVIPSSGIVSAGSSVDVEVSLLTYSTQGLFVETLLINSNDINIPVFEYILEIEQVIGCIYVMCTDYESVNLTGRVYDSGGPLGNYSNNENCGFLIQPPCADEIILSFNQFFIQNSFDFLRIYDGVDHTGELLLTATGSALPNSVTATSGLMFLSFTSNGSGVTSGFDAQWTTVEYLEANDVEFTVSPITPVVGEVVYFTNSSTGGIVSWSWDVTGDGIEDYTSQNPSHIYNTPGTYDVELTVVDCNGGTSTHIETIVVNYYPEIVTSLNDSLSLVVENCTDVVSYTFEITNEGIGNLIWEIESLLVSVSPQNGMLEAGSTQLVTVEVESVSLAGVYNDVLTITSNDQNSPVIDIPITITQEVSCQDILCESYSSTNTNGLLYDPYGVNSHTTDWHECFFSINPNCADTLFVSISDLTLAGTSFMRIYEGTGLTGELIQEWSIENQFTSSIYALSGAVFVHYFNDHLDTSNFELSWMSGVKSDTIPFEVLGNNGFTLNEITFVPEENEFINQWYWDFGDETSSEENEPTHIYTEEGCYTVILVVEGQDCLEPFSKEICVTTEQETNEGVINLYPNPANTDITVQHNDKIIEIRMYSQLGQEIPFSIIETKDYTIKVDVSHLSAAWYYMVINDTTVLKFVKMN
jgi:PKD repeat protein